MSMWLPAILLGGAIAVFAAAQVLMRKRWASHDDELVEHIDALLPQTQCAQCGYPGCRPYAAAIVAGEAALNLCPPGGEETFRALSALMGNVKASPPAAAASVLAYIDERQCIGCALCLPACPVDAIVGAPGMMHTVIADECTGCELCVPACPVDCIDLRPQPAPTPRKPRRAVAADTYRGCIHCGACSRACPVQLDAHALFLDTKPDPQHSALAACIECGLCDRECPSDIPLAAIFGARRSTMLQAREAQAQRERLKQRFANHQARARQTADTAQAKRAQRIAGPREW